MTPRMARWLLWIALVAMLPVPVVLGIQTGLMPVARIGLLAAASLGVVLLENANGAAPLLIGLLLVQALGYMLAFWLAALLGVRGMAHRGPRVLATATVALVLVGIVLAVATEPYRTPFRRGGTGAGLLEVFE